MAAKKRTASPKPKTQAAIERERAAAARARFAREKKRSAAALKGWAARRSPENTYDRMVRNLEQYKKSGTKRYYRLFRTDKRLLFEAMLPSVLWARDRYLAPAGLMVPSHCVLHVAPLADAALVADNVEFWHDVYGFNMQAMMEKIYDDVLVRTASPETMAGPSDPFLVLPLHTIQVADLTFRRPFAVTVFRPQFSPCPPP